MKKTVFASLVGRSNVGKSSLVNGLLGRYISIVSRRPQTTRNRIAAVLTKDLEQIVIYDTPGFFDAKDRLGENMIKILVDSIFEVDVVLMVVEPVLDVSMFEKELIRKFQKLSIPIILVVNKADLLKDIKDVYRIYELYCKLFSFEAKFLVSSVFKEGFDLLIDGIRKYEVESEHFFPCDVITDKSEKFIVCEILRQKLLLNIRDEIPHGTATMVDRIKEAKKLLFIDCTIYCSKNSHKGIIIGKNGSMMKKIATQARIDIEKFFNRKVNLKCWVKVKPDWKNKDSVLKMLEC